MVINIENAQQPDRKPAGIAASGKTPRLLLHCCCAPCASHVLEYLSPVYDITIFFYNPNIQPREEYHKRAGEFGKLARYAAQRNTADSVFVDTDFAEFDTLTASLFSELEGGLRCRICFEMRLGKTADHARENGFDLFATTLSVSPHKNAKQLNEIGNVLAEESGVEFYSADFKKRDGYKRSIELSKQYDLYRQSYCGCRWSMDRQR